MVAISTASMYQTALQNIVNAQQSEITAEAQAGSGTVASDLQGYGSSAATLVATNSLQSRITTYLSNGQQVAGKLDMQNQALSSLATASQTASSAISTALGTNDASGLMATLGSAFGQASGALNTQYDGQYLFAGGQVNTQPFTGTSAAALTSGPVSGLFQNDQSAATNRLDDSTVVKTGVLASNVGTPLMQAMSAIEAYDQGPNGPLTGTLTSTQSAYLQSVLGQFASAVSSANAAVSENGIVQNQVSAAQTSLSDQQSTLKGVIGNITDVNEGQVATNLTLAQTALQASAQVFSSLQSDSLLNILSPSSA